MDEQQQKPKFVSRSPALSGKNGSGKPRSQWDGMDLHTTTRSSNSRAMYTPTSTPPPPMTASPSNTAINTNNNNTNTNTNFMKMKSDEGAISARNIVIRRKLSERKRFDSADHAMRKMMDVMHHAPADPNPASSPPPSATAGGGGGNHTAGYLASPRLSPSHARLGASVFLGAFQDNGNGDDYEMKDEDDNDSGDGDDDDALPQQQQQQLQQPAASSRYGGLGGGGGSTNTNTNTSTSTMSANGALSARNIMIQRRLHEKRHFDSADWQLAQNGVTTDASLDTAPIDAIPVQISRSPSPFSLNGGNDMATSTAPAPRAGGGAVSSPSAARVAMMRNAHLYPHPQMSPSLRGSNTSSTSAATTRNVPDESKYAGLSGSNELIQRRLAEKKFFDSADDNRISSTHQQSKKAAAFSSSSSQPLSRTAILRQQQEAFMARQASTATTGAGGGGRVGPPAVLYIGGSGASIVAPPPAPIGQTPLAAAAVAAAATGVSKYGKLCATNILLRKNLKERKRFDSADYQMEQAQQSGPDAMPSSSRSGAAIGPSPLNATLLASSDKYGSLGSPSMNPQAKHIKLSEGAAPSRWATHPSVVAATRSSVPATMFGGGGGGSNPLQSQSRGDAAAASSVSSEGRLAARSVVIHRHLAEKKRFVFDSADHFAAKAAASRGRRELNRHHG